MIHSKITQTKAGDKPGANQRKQGLTTTPCCWTTAQQESPRRCTPPQQDAPPLRVQAHQRHPRANSEGVRARRLLRRHHPAHRTRRRQAGTCRVSSSLERRSTTY
jgi:hypothetical protein